MDKEDAYIHNRLLLGHRKRMKFCHLQQPWMDREGRLREIYQRNTNTAFYHFHVESKYKTKE